MSDGLGERKRAHLELCADGEVEYRGKTTLLEEVELVHDALPELAESEVSTEVSLLGKRLQAPLLITGMTGGTAEATAINRDLAAVAEAHGIAFGLGSQRAMQREPALAGTFAVRTQAPGTLVLANLGVVQAAQLPSAEIARLVETIAADALCIHLNPAQELIQPGGDRDFRGGLAAIARLVRELPCPVVVKETGCGISRTVARRLQDCGVQTIDVSGAGGTSWVRVEALRGDTAAQALGEEFADWGIPTAAALLGVRGLGLACIASGGIRSGLDVAKTIALGAVAAGVALPVFRAYTAGGVTGAGDFVGRLVAGLRTAMLLTGARDLSALGRVPTVLGPRLKAWVDFGGGE
ncbi:MAG TPA: type 2 isopentenyl-diphosphate Delta-isomerase [Candidatus Limnocylindria bacterium]|nr:type 2 isopentenyl-diphosphate Delta-isomerase [Candidatus Limnocylindria bacterium]